MDHGEEASKFDSNTNELSKNRTMEGPDKDSHREQMLVLAALICIALELAMRLSHR